MSKMRIHRIRFSVVALACIPLLWLACRRTEQPAAPPGPAVTSSGWALDNGKRETIANHKGRVLLLDFYATWCEPCRLETPHLVTLQQKYGTQGLQVIGLNVGGTDDYPEIPAFKQEFAIPFILAIPDDEFVDEYLGLNQNIPQTFLINRQGSVVKHFIGYGEGRETELESAVQAALQGP